MRIRDGSNHQRWQSSRSIHEEHFLQGDMSIVGLGRKNSEQWLRSQICVSRLANDE